LIKDYVAPFYTVTRLGCATCNISRGGVSLTVYCRYQLPNKYCPFYTSKKKIEYIESSLLFSKISFARSSSLTNELIRKAHSRKLELRMKMGPHNNVEELLKLPHRTKAEWLKNTNTNIEKKLRSNREKDTARARWEEGQLDWNPNADAPKTAASSKTKTAPKAIPKPKDLN
jgi:hypothetical protein